MSGVERRFGAHMYTRPLLSASVYGETCLDALVTEALPRVLASSRNMPDGESAYLWFSRYGKGGEHLKIRFHGARSIEESARCECESVFRETLEAVPPLPADHVRELRANLPSIDDEDDVEEPYPDRTIIWTEFQSRPLTLGSEVFVGDEEYEKRFFLCLARTAETVMSGLQLKGGGIPSTPTRQRVVLKMALSCLDGYGLRGENIYLYLKYHRDWLSRWILMGVDPAKMGNDELQAIFERQTEKRGLLLERLMMMIDAIGEVSSHRLSEAPAYRPGIREAAMELLNYTCTFRGDSRYDLDPYSEDEAFLPLFKVLHAAANQAGLAIRQEAFTYHLLMSAAERWLAEKAPVSVTGGGGAVA